MLPPLYVGPDPLGHLLPIPGTSRRSFTLACSIPFLPPKCLSRACIFFAPRPSTSSSGSASAPFPLRFLWNALENLWASSRAWTSALPFLSSRIVSLPSCGVDSSSLRALLSGTGPGAPSRLMCSLWPIGASRPRRGVAGQATPPASWPIWTLPPTSSSGRPGHRT